MEKQSALLLAAPSQEQLVAAISRRLSVAGVIGLGGASWFRSLALPVFADIDSALAQVRPDVVCFLAPSSRMGDLLRQAVKSDLPVLSAGPPDLPARAWRALSGQIQGGGPPLVWGRRFAHSDAHRRMMEQSLGALGRKSISLTRVFVAQAGRRTSAYQNYQHAGRLVG